MGAQQEVFKTYIVGNNQCQNTIDAFLEARGYKPGIALDEASWTYVMGEGDLARPDEQIYDGLKVTTMFNESPNKIMRRVCTEFYSTHKDIYYKRLTPLPANFDMLNLMMNDWVSQDNLLNVDFELYSTYTDALVGDASKRWTYCNYNDLGIGFPRDCGPTGRVNWNCIDCCRHRSRDYKVELFDGIGGGNVVETRILSGYLPVMNVVDFEGAQGYTLRITPTFGNYKLLSLAEVQVFGDLDLSKVIKNIAGTGTASQSSTAHGGGAERAIDGDINGYWNGKSVTHTNWESIPWWKLTLPEPAKIAQVVLYNRSDCCWGRLNRPIVEVWKGGVLVKSMDYPGPSWYVPRFGGASYSLDNVEGDEVRVWINRNGILSLAEVLVYSHVDESVITPAPVVAATAVPSASPSAGPTAKATADPSASPTGSPVVAASDSPSKSPTGSPVVAASDAPSKSPTGSPVVAASDSPSKSPTLSPVATPVAAASEVPSKSPTIGTSSAPTTLANVVVSE